MVAKESRPSGRRGTVSPQGWLVLLLCLSLPLFLLGCDGDSTPSTDTPPPTASTQPEPESEPEPSPTEVIGSDGGPVQFAATNTHPYAVRLEIPKDALAANTVISISPSTTSVGSLQVPVYTIEPLDLTLREAAELTVSYQASDQATTATAFGSDSDDHTPLLLFYVAPNGNLILDASARYVRIASDAANPALALLSIGISTSVKFILLRSKQYRSLYQFEGFFNPNEPTALVDIVETNPLGRDRVETIRAPLSYVTSSSFALDPAPPLGSGSFEAAALPRSKNLILIHGITSDASTFAGANGLLEAFAGSGEYNNVFLYQYRSGLSIEENGARFRDHLIAKRICSPDIIAHSMGGLVARWAIENFDELGGNANSAHELSSADCSPIVSNLVTIGTPHRGATDATILTLADELWWSDRDLGQIDLIDIQGLQDLRSTSQFYQDLRASPKHYTTNYYLIAGNIAGSWDGRVAVTSAIPPESEFPRADQRTLGAGRVKHSELINWATENGVADQIRAWLTPVATPAPAPQPVYHELRVSRVPASGGVVEQSPVGPPCGTGCFSYLYTATVAVTARAGAGWMFERWTGACSGQGARCTLDMHEDHTTTALYVQEPVIPPPSNFPRLTIRTSGRGHVSSLPDGIRCGEFCSATFTDGQNVRLYAVPDGGWSIGRWSGCSGGDSCSVRMDRDKSVNVYFEPIRTTLSLSVSGRGTVYQYPVGASCTGSCSRVYDHGTEVILVPEADRNWDFSHWAGPCIAISGDGCRTIMTSSRSISANFYIPKISRSNSSDYEIPDNNRNGVQSPITITGAPANARVKRIEIEYRLDHSAPVQLYVDFSRRGFDYAHKLCSWWFGCNRGEATIDSSDSSPLIDLPVNGTWYLWVGDYVPFFTGSIDRWSITIYY